MCRFDLTRCRRLVVGAVMGLAVNAAVHADETGVVRISDGTSQPVIRGQSPDAPLLVPTDCEVGPYCPPHGVSGPSNGLVIGTSPTWDEDDGEPCPDGWGPAYGTGTTHARRPAHGSGRGGVIDCPHCHFGEDCPHCRGRGFLDPLALGRHDTGNFFVDCFAKGCDKLLGFVHDRFQFEESGGDGAGVPLLGHYCLTYPVNPAYFDGRDGQVYAAQGYGGPVSVPLAPVVRHTYNYGWGIPSSRLTPISHPINPNASSVPPATVPQIQQTRLRSR